MYIISKDKEVRWYEPKENKTGLRLDFVLSETAFLNQYYL